MVKKGMRDRRGNEKRMAHRALYDPAGSGMDNNSVNNAVFNTIFLMWRADTRFMAAELGIDECIAAAAVPEILRH
jgi:hypothetical protein